MKGKTWRLLISAALAFAIAHFFGWAGLLSYGAGAVWAMIVDLWVDREIFDEKMANLERPGINYRRIIRPDSETQE
jgi:hypothetical protein